MLESIREWLDQSGYAQSTQDTYLDFLRYFYDWLVAESIQIDDADASSVTRWMKERDWSNGTQYIAACAVKSFTTWYCGEKHPIAKMRVTREKPDPQRTLDEDQIVQLLESIDTSTPRGKRNLALVTFMLDTGFRAAEVCRLKLEHLNLKDQTALVRIKGGEVEYGVFSEYTASCLASWLNIRSLIARPGVKTVFVAVQSHRGKPMTRDGLRSVFRKLGFRSDIGLISPHDFRRTFATLSTRYGAPTRIVQVAGRWSDIKMVERYTPKIKAEDFRPYFPVGKVMGIKTEK